MNHGDLFDLIGAKEVHTVAGMVTRVSGSDVFVVAPGFDDGLEFGPCLHTGAAPALGTRVLVALMSDTTEAWIISSDSAGGGAFAMNCSVDTINPSGSAPGSGNSTTGDPIPHFLLSTPRAVLLQPIVDSGDGRDDYLMTVAAVDASTFTPHLRVALAETYGYSGDAVNFFWLALA